jgi:pantoate--beta-alanine ligase
MSLQLVKSLEEVRAWLADARRAGEGVALVPTMGFLHAGHIALMEEAKRRAPRVAVSLFVNPTQFGPKEDLSRYPRDLEGDTRKCREAGVGLLFVPEVSTLYPSGYQTYVEVERVSQGLDGASRPGHFRGVATVVTQLLSLFRPEFAVFGEKDYQQLQVIRALNRDLHLNAHIVGVPTLREEDGLARSSRNAYLSPDERKRAVALSRGLFVARDQAASGETSTQKLTEAVRTALREADVREDYVQMVDAETLQPLNERQPGRPARLLVAGWLGQTRLIDNIAL